MSFLQVPISAGSVHQNFGNFSWPGRYVQVTDREPPRNPRTVPGPVTAPQPVETHGAAGVLPPHRHLLPDGAAPAVGGSGSTLPGSSAQASSGRSCMAGAGRRGSACGRSRFLSAEPAPPRAAPAARPPRWGGARGSPGLPGTGGRRRDERSDARQRLLEPAGDAGRARRGSGAALAPPVPPGPGRSGVERRRPGPWGPAG